MCALVPGKIAAAKRVRQHHSLAERKTQSFARNCIDRARRIADQHNISPPDAFQFAIRSQRAPFGRGRLGSGQPRVEFRKIG